MAFSIVRLESGDLRVSIGTDFVPEDAWRLHDLLGRASDGTRVELDFRRVRECHDFALSLLAREILAGRAVFDLYGMTQHQERVLTYFGVPAGTHVAAADLDPV